MAKPGFYLKNAKATNPTLVFLIYKLHTGKNFKYSTGESIHPDFWDKALQRAKTNLKGNPTQLVRNKEINLQITRYDVKITEILSSLKAANQSPTVELLRAEMDKEFLKDTHPRRVAEEAKKLTMLQWIESWIENVKLTRETPPRPINPRTKQKYRATLKVLKHFANKRRGKLDWGNIDMDFYGDFTE